MAKKAPAIPLKDIMAALDKRDRGYYNRLTSEQKKAFSSWMMMRYASSVQGKDAAHYIYMTNELVNRDYSEVSKHPELQWLLLSACGVGKIQFHPYLKPPNAKNTKLRQASNLGKKKFETYFENLSKLCFLGWP